MNEKRIILVILDGLGDRPAVELGGKTPLQAACKPALAKSAYFRLFSKYY